jgi:hypothetical protein
LSEPPQGTQQGGTGSRGAEPHHYQIERALEPGEQLEHRREGVRAWLAGGLAILFGSMVIAIFVSAVVGGEQWTRVQEFSQIAFGMVAGFVGSVVGFYYGSQR